MTVKFAEKREELQKIMQEIMNGNNFSGKSLRLIM